MKHTLMILLTSAMVACGQEYTFEILAGGGGTFQNPTDAVVDSAGNVYVADYGHNQIKKITPGGDVSVLAGTTCGYQDGPGNQAKFISPVGVAVDSAFNVYVADRGNRAIRKITPAGDVTTIAGMPINNCNTGGVSGGDDGPGESATFKYLHGISVDSAGNVYVADREGPTIRKLTPNGVGGYDVLTIAGAFGQSATADGTNDGINNETRFRNDSPSGVPVDSAGNIYVMDRTSHNIRKITPDGVGNYVSTTIAGTGTAGFEDGMASTEARFYLPYNGSFDGAGNLYVADTGGGNGGINVYGFTVRKLTPVGGDWVVTTIGGETGVPGNTQGPGSQTHFGGDSPFGVSADSAGNVYVTDYGNHLIIKGTAPFVQTINITSIQLVGGNVQIDFTADPNDAANSFTLTSSSTVDGTYNDANPAAALSQVGPAGSFRAIIAPSGNTQFYRVKK